MIQQTSIINWEALSHSEVNQNPFPYLIIDNFLKNEYKEVVCKDFPNIRFPGSISLNDVKYGQTFQRLLDELHSDTLKTVIEQKFAMDLQQRPTLITLRGRTRKRDGQIHTDTKSKLITVLLYLNPEWTSSGGQLRLLNNGNDLNDYVAEVPPLWGRCVIFKVTDNCWHGHTRFTGQRKSLQLNYLVDETTLKQQSQKHQLAAKWKAFRFLFAKEY
jgi:SM-20-related protein